MTTALYYLRAVQLGLTLDEMQNLDEGFVVDMLIESSNDQHQDEYKTLATQKDFDAF